MHCHRHYQRSAIRDDIGFFQAVKAALAKQRGERKSSGSLDHAVRQLVAKAIAPEGEIIDVFAAAGLPQPNLGILSEQFLAEVRGLKYKNVAAELLAKVLGDEIRVRSKRNLVQSREFSEVLKKALNAYHNRAIATQEVIEELIKLAKEMSAATQRGVDWTLRENARAKIKVMVKRILRKHGYWLPRDPAWSGFAQRFSLPMSVGPPSSIHRTWKLKL